MKIDRPLFEFDLPDFIALADELLELLEEAERERIRILNNTPIVMYTPSYRAKRERAAKRKAMRAGMIQLPEWFLNPLGEDQEEDTSALEAEIALK